MLDRLSSAEFAEWMAYDTIKPFGPPAAASEAGLVASTFFNMSRGKDVDPPGPADFMPQIRRPEKKRPSSAALGEQIKALLPPRDR